MRALYTRFRGLVRRRRIARSTPGDGSKPRWCPRALLRAIWRRRARPGERVRRRRKPSFERLSSVSRRKVGTSRPCASCRRGGRGPTRESSSVKELRRSTVVRAVRFPSDHEHLRRSDPHAHALPHRNSRGPRRPARLTPALARAGGRAGGFLHLFDAGSSGTGSWQSILATNVLSTWVCASSQAPRVRRVGWTPKPRMCEIRTPTPTVPGAADSNTSS